jgi:hypothetical protein
MGYFVAYVLAILAVNIGFSYVPLIATPLGMLSPIAIAVGGIFVLRDYVQRSIGHHVLWGVGIGAVLSWWLADPFVAIASVLAFVSSELADWALYTITKKPFHQRVWVSSLLSTPIDTAVFLLWIDQMHVGTFILMVLSKLIAAAVIWTLGNKGVKV